MNPAASTTAADTLDYLGAIVLAAALMSFVGGKEYLHVSTINRVIKDGYAANTKRTISTGVSAFTSVAELKGNVQHGLDVDKAMKKAAHIGKVDLMEYLYGSSRVVVSAGICLLLAKHGHLDALRWGLSRGAIRPSMLTTKVNSAALRGGHIGVFRWSVEKTGVIKMADLEVSVKVGGPKHLAWALKTFPTEKNTIALGVALGNMPNALQLYKEVDCTGVGEAGGIFLNFLSVFRGGNVEILSYLASKLWSANVDADTGRDWIVHLGARLRFMDDNRGHHSISWFDEKGMSWAKDHAYFRNFFA